jgi:hypothetical protein
MISFVFLVVLVVGYLKKVSGNLRGIAILNIFYIGFLMIAILTDHIPILLAAPDLFIILSPIFFCISLILGFISIDRICEEISFYYNQAHICTVHRGEIPFKDKIFICPDCSTTYCQKCYLQVIKNDGCWNCLEQIDIKVEDAIQVSDLKNKSIKKKENKIPTPSRDILI